MDRHIDELSSGTRTVFQDSLNAGTRVLRVAPDQDNVSDITVVNLLFRYLIGMVKPAHETEHEDLIRMSGDNLLRFPAFFYGI